jgi:(1->4)-alpha-D-glucan 1-alpha-D-glucosylmutase
VAVARIPLSTYRLQFNSGFTFRDARAVVDYLHDLGISDCYASSYLKAVPGSPHGYDVADPTRLNPEIGTDAEYWTWIHALHARGMGHVMDLVPNHMGIAKSANPWWLDVLDNGPSSRFARFFDIEWHPVKDELADKVLIPILGDQYGAVLERQELQLTYRDGAFFVRYDDETLPIAPDTCAAVLEGAIDRWLDDHSDADADELQSILTASRNLPTRSDRAPEAMAVRAREKDIVKRRLAALADTSPDVATLIDDSVRRLNGIAGQPRSFDRLDRLLNMQSFRLAHWRVASEEINYRRFFDVTELAALRMEDPVVFDKVHRFAFDLVHRGAVTGLRIDHVDGLFAPGDYLRRLQERCAGVRAGVGSQLPIPFTSSSRRSLARESNSQPIGPCTARRGTSSARRSTTCSSTAATSARSTTSTAASSASGGSRSATSPTGARSRSCTRRCRATSTRWDTSSIVFPSATGTSPISRSIASTLKEVIACFPVYRMYVTAGDPMSDHDRRYIVEAVQSARRRAPGVTGLMFDFIERLLLKHTSVTTPEECEERARFIGTLQQITSPVAAKGIEDTALYVYNRLVSLNEVGSDPTQFGLEPGAVHDWMIARQRRSPSALSATSTHDTKRGEDVRARLNVLSEIPVEWKATNTRWRAVNRRFKTEIRGTLVPDPNDEYLIYQALIGAWPFETSLEAATAFRDRVAAYMTKALRESKVHTSWLSPDEEYETAVERFYPAMLDVIRHASETVNMECYIFKKGEIGTSSSRRSASGRVPACA